MLCNVYGKCTHLVDLNSKIPVVKYSHKCLEDTAMTSRSAFLWGNLYWNSFFSSYNSITLSPKRIQNPTHTYNKTTSWTLRTRIGHTIHLLKFDFYEFLYNLHRYYVQTIRPTAGMPITRINSKTICNIRFHLPLSLRMNSKLYKEIKSILTPRFLAWKVL
jgi:hypothetical protein